MLQSKIVYFVNLVLPRYFYFYKDISDLSGVVYIYRCFIHRLRF